MKEQLETLATKAIDGDRDALSEIVEALRDDLYHLSFRMLGLRADAEDATQEILVKILTHLSEFRGESKVRTWAWRIAVNHLLRAKKSKREEAASFETIEMLIERGDARPPMPDVSDPELSILAEEVRLSCTQAMVMSLDRDHRVAWILAEVFELSGDAGAGVLGIEAPAFRKRVSRARERLAQWMGGKCGLANASNACRCERQVPVAMEFGVVLPSSLEYAGHPAREEKRRRLELAKESTAIEAAADALKQHPDYAAPAELRARMKALIDSGQYRLFDT
jgi:RNA polymerase sigma factor (sigma-70 family)